MAGRRCLDAGASTGGFTDVLLRHGAARGGRRRRRLRPAGLAAAAGRAGARARPHQRPRPRPRELIGGPVDVVVGDLSFISLSSCSTPLLGVTAPDGDLVLMVKPQFEVGKDRVGKGGVVRDPGPARGGGRRRWPPAAAARGWGARAVTVSPLPGPVGQRRVLPVAAPGSGARSTDRAIDARGVGRSARGCRMRRWTRERADDRPAPRPRCSRTPAGPRRATSACQLVDALQRARHRGPAAAPTRPPPSGSPTTPDVELGEASGDPSADCELVVVIGGDGTILRAAELAHDSGHAAARGQPRPRRVPGRGGVRRRRRPPSTRSWSGATPPRTGSRSTSSVFRDGELVDQHLRAQRGQRREGRPRADARGRRRGRRAAAVALGLRRRGLRDADRLHGVQLQRRRPDRVARRRGAADGADQRARAVRPAAGGRARPPCSPSR